MSMNLRTRRAACFIIMAIAGASASGAAARSSPSGPVHGPAHTAVTTTAAPNHDTTAPQADDAGESQSAAPGQATAAPQFVEDFSTADGFYERFVTDVDHAFEPWLAPDHVPEWSGDHDMSCAGPDTSRTIHVRNFDEYFWHCAPRGPESGHVMTSVTTVGYAIIAFAPDETFTHVSRVCWDQNLTDLGGRKWTQVIIIPDAEYLANAPRLGYVNEDFRDPDGPTTGLLPSDESLGIRVHVGTFTVFSGSERLFHNGDPYQVADKARRYRHCAVDNGDGTITLTQERDDGVHEWIASGSFPDGPVRVIFQDDNYDPPKSPPTLPVVNGNTWHWDNIEIA
jgi:hypothetical protein